MSRAWPFPPATTVAYSPPPRVPAAGRWRRGRSRPATRRGGCPPSCPSPGAPARVGRSVPCPDSRDADCRRRPGHATTRSTGWKSTLDGGHCGSLGWSSPTVVPGLQRDHVGLVGCEPLFGEGDQSHLPAVSGEAHPLARAQQPLHGPQAAPVGSVSASRPTTTGSEPRPPLPGRLWPRSPCATAETPPVSSWSRRISSGAVRRPGPSGTVTGEVSALVVGVVDQGRGPGDRQCAARQHRDPQRSDDGRTVSRRTRRRRCRRS